jgi:thioredoxin reductase
MSFLETDRELTVNSYYAATATRSAFHPPLESDVEADVAIVGGGLAGLSAAIELADRGFKVVPVVIKNLPDGYRVAVIDPPSIEVEIKSPFVAAATFKPSEEDATEDALGLTEAAVDQVKTFGTAPSVTVTV